MTITYTTKPGEFANSYHATVGDLNIVLEKIANEYLSWSVFITSTAEGVDGRTVELSRFALTLSASKARVLAFLADYEAALNYAGTLALMEPSRLVSELETSVRCNSYGSHEKQIAMVRKEIIARMSN